MEVRKTSFVYKVAYAWDESSQKPVKTNLCRLFWRFIFSIFIMWPLGQPFLKLIIGIIWVLAFLFSKRPDWENGPPEDLFPDYKRWPRFRGHRVWPVTVILGAILVWLVFGSIKDLVAYLPWGDILIYISWGYMLIYSLIVAGIVACLIFSFICRRFSKSETWKFVKEYVLAKKKKVCPEVWFTE